MARYSVAETAAKHSRILQEASRLFRERGFHHVSVSEIMQAAHLTHGAFYAHFQSKEDLQAAAVAYGLAESLERALHVQGSPSYTDGYLSEGHRDNPGNGCTMAALAQDIAQAPIEVKATFDRGMEPLLALEGEDRQKAIFRTSAMVGALLLARAVQNKALSSEILQAVRQELGYEDPASKA